MATVVQKWVSADGDVGATASYSQNLLPTIDDELFFPSTNSQAVNVDVAALTAIDLNLLYVDKGFRGVIGTDGVPLEFSADLVKFFGGKAFHYKDGGGDTDLVIINAASPSTIITLDGDTITKIIVLRGNVTIKSSFGTLVDLEVGWVNNRQSDATVTIQAGVVTPITNLRASGGVINSSSVITNVIVDGGNYTQDTATATNVDIYSGFFNYNFAGTITALNLRGGTTDFTQNDLSKVVTNTNRFPNSVFKYDDDVTTFTNAINDMRASK